MSEPFYTLFKYANRSGNRLETLAQPFPKAGIYIERIMDTLSVARSSGDTAQAKTICALCDCALSALPPRDKTNPYDIQFRTVVCKRILRRMSDTTHDYLATHTNGIAKSEYDLRDMETLPPTMHPDIKQFIELQSRLKPKSPKKK